MRFLAAGGEIVVTADPATLGPMIDAVLSAATDDPGLAARVTDSQTTNPRGEKCPRPAALRALVTGTVCVDE